MLKWKVVTIPLLVLAAAITAMAELCLVQDGVPRGGIYLDNAAKPGEKTAAEELQFYLRKISQADFKTENSRQNCVVVLATVNTPGIPENLKAPLRGRKDESYLLKTLNGKLYIIGKTQVGTLYGAYGVLSDYLQVRWFMPGEEYTEQRKTIVLPELDRVEEPVFLWRTVSQTSAGGFARDSKIWAARNRLQCPSGALNDPAQKEFFDARIADHVIDIGGHLAFYNAVPPQKYLKTNPEYFALVKGKRLQNKEHNNTHHCLSNLQVQKLTANHISRIYRQHGRRVTYLFGAPDSIRDWCECEKCRSLDAKDRLDLSRRYHRTVQKIAKMVYARHPDIRLDVWAYANYRQLPEGMKIDRRMNVYFCTHGRCYAHRIDDPDCVRNVRVLTQLKEWIAVKPRAIHLYEYAHCTPIEWTPLEAVLSADLKTYRKLGIKGWKEEIAFPDANHRQIPEFTKNPQHPAHRLGYNWFYFAVAARLTWNPDLKVEEVIADIESKYYGKSYAAMKKFHDLRRQAWANGHGCFGYPNGDNRTAEVLMKPGLRSELTELLDQAEMLAADDAVLLRRLKRDRQYLEVFWLGKNDRLRAKKAPPINAPTARSRIKIDGNGDDPAWLGARWIADFRSISSAEETQSSSAANNSVGILSDKHNLYFLILTDGKAAVNELEILLDPDNDRSTYYRLRVNASGKADWVQLPNGKKMNSNVAAAVGETVDKKRVFEIKLPMKSTDGIFMNGALWNFNIICSSRGDGTVPRRIFSLNGIGKNERSKYPSLTIGRALIANGDFSVCDSKTMQPEHWTLNNGKVVERSDRNAVVLARHGSAMQLVWDWLGPLAQAPRARRIKVNVRASGSGKLHIKVLNYHDDWGGEKLKRTSHPTDPIGEIVLAEQPKTRTFSYTIKPDRWIGLSLYAPNGAVIEKVFITVE